jgi:hypothetical protein
LAAIIAIAVGLSYAAPAAANPDIARRIVEEGRAHSELMKNFEYMTDMIGPRLTGSKKFKRAAEWAAQRMRDYGIQNVHLESWPFGRGWQRGIAYGKMTAPYEMQLDFRALAWTPGTQGKVSGPVVLIDGSTESDLDKYKGKLKGAFVLPGEPSKVEPDFHPHALRMSDSGFDELETSWPSGPQPTAEEREAMRQMMRAFQFRATLAKFAKAQGAAALIVDSGRPHGLLNAGSYAQGRNPQEPETLPMVTMVHEHYGTLYRLVHGGVPVSIEMEVSNQFEDGDNNAYNVVGEIPGKSKPDEVVILGAHLDSWDLGTGATDNGAGSIAVLEAARILGALKLGQARTIRFILFGGEEQGLLGSRAYVAAHKDEMARVSGVFVIDTGTGKVRGIGTEGIKEEIPIFTDILAPLKELGVLYVNDRRQMGTDHLSFGMAGVPGFAFFQDAIEYRDKTHHTQTDTLDKVLPEDLEEGAITMAVMGHSVAELPGLLPRRAQPAAN